MDPSIISILYVVVFFGIFYFMLIRPQQKRTKELASLRDKLQVGDKILTVGGIVGTIKALRGDDLVVETGENFETVLMIKRWAVGSIIE